MIPPPTAAAPDPRRDDIVAGYLARLGVDGRPPPTAATLDTLHRAHLRRVPFENLDLHIARPITLDVERFVAKIVADRRGGFCYELNGAFAALLTALGFTVDLLEARVHGADGPVQEFDHLCLRVSAPGLDPVLADVGFGECFDAPVPLTYGIDHHDTNGMFRLERVDDEWSDLVRGDGPQYRFSSRARPLGDFAPGCAFHQSPASHFTRNTIASLRTDTGRVTVRGLTLVRTVDGTRSEDAIAPADLGAVLATELGIDLPPADLARLVAASAR